MGDEERRLQPINKFHVMNSIKNYDITRRLGQGTFGVVQKARNIRTNEDVALKQLLNHSAKEGFPITALREITIVKKLNHKNILKIIDMIYEEPKVSNSHDLIHQRGCFYTVSPYMCSDLVGLLENPNINLRLAHIKCIMKQLLEGIQYVHEQHFLHRDIKAANILLDFDGMVKIADFGLARQYQGKVPSLGNGPGGGDRAYTGLVVTRWYRPPELLLGERKYTTAVDMWGIGCVFAELFTQKPILVGQTDSHQAQLIFSLVGSPSSWNHASTLPNKQDFHIGLTCKRTLEERFKNIMPANGISLLSGLLSLDPYQRLNAEDALNNDFFKSDPLPIEPKGLPKFEESHEIDKERFKKLREGKKEVDTYDSQGAQKFKGHNSYSFAKYKGRGNYPSGPGVPYSQSRQPSHQSSNNSETLRRNTSQSSQTVTSYSRLRDRSPKSEVPYRERISQPHSVHQRPQDESSNFNEKIHARSANEHISSSGVLRSSRKRTPAFESSIHPSIKRSKKSEEGGESDLTDFDEDVKETEQLSSFLEP